MEKKNSGKKCEIISLGINIGSFKTVYSTFSKEKGDNYKSNILLMNNRSRIIPSIMCYTKNNRLFGENSISFLKKNLETSYNNLSRIFGFDNNLTIYKDEHFFALKQIKKITEYKLESIELKISTSNIIVDFLSLINEYFFHQEKIQYNSTVISIPDFYTFNLKQNLKLICESINLKDVTLIPESNAITMYYGYIKYYEFFLMKNKINTFTIRNILFIDFGHSKISFILSSFKYNEFKVEYVLCNPFLGGRNFDYLISKYCVQEFKKINNLNKIEINSKMKYKLIEAIRNARIKLSYNNEIMIYVKSFYDNINLNINLTRENLNNICNLVKNNDRDFIKEFKDDLNEILNYAKQRNIIIHYVEIAGELMNTPIFKEIILQNNLELLNSINIDECTSLGSAIFNHFLKGNLPFKHLSNFISYNYFSLFYEIIYDNNIIINDELLPKGNITFKEKIIEFENYSNVEVIIFRLYFPENEKEVKSKYNYYIKYIININKILKENNEILENDNFIFKIDANDNHTFSSGKFFIGNIKIKTNIQKLIGDIYKIKDEEIIYKKKIQDYIKYQDNSDYKFKQLNEEKMKVLNYFYSLKDLIDKNNLVKEDLEIKIIEKFLNDKNLDIEDLHDIKEKMDIINKRIENTINQV